ncbi:MAG: hypothetical protein K2N79_00220, partial [Muribaculaceae bacterium]|nr:hypothetical protein [Muribaculaceae bacterium]
MNTVRLFKLLTLSICLLLSQSINAQRSSIVDFSAPQTVMKDSRKDLSKAIDNNNSPEIVASLINLTLAKSLI